MECTEPSWFLPPSIREQRSELGACVNVHCSSACKKYQQNKALHIMLEVAFVMFSSDNVGVCFSYDVQFSTEVIG